MNQVAKRVQLSIYGPKQASIWKKVVWSLKVICKLYISPLQVGARYNTSLSSQDYDGDPCLWVTRANNSYFKF